MLGTEQERVQDYFRSVMLEFEMLLVFFQKNRFVLGLGVLITKSSNKHCWYAFLGWKCLEVQNLDTIFKVMAEEIDVLIPCSPIGLPNNMFERKHIHG